jgi:hypothetical protein
MQMSCGSMAESQNTADVERLEIRNGEHSKIGDVGISGNTWYHGYVAISIGLRAGRVVQIVTSV